MKCPYCGSFESKVVDSRPTEDGERIRRRRECVDCSKRFTTFETIELSPIMVQKKNGSIQAFNRDKLLNGMIKSGRRVPENLPDITTGLPQNGQLEAPVLWSATISPPQD